MALEQYKDPTSQTYFGYDPTNQQAIAFSDPTQFNKYFSSFDANAPAPTFDVSKLLTSPNQLTSLAPSPEQTLAQQSAQGGLSAEDYLKAVTGSVTPEEKQKVYDQLGISQLEQSVFTPPSSTTQQLYTDAYKQAGLGDLKTNIKTLLDQINKARSDFTQASGVVNENPFLSEASRVGRISRLQDKSQAQLGNLINQLSQLQDLYNNGINEVNSMVSRQGNDFQTNQSLNEQKLQYLLQKAEGQFGDLQTSKTQKAYSYLPDYLKAKANATTPDLIGTADTGYYKWDSNTGTFVQVIQPTQTSKVLSVTEAARLGVPYGTTQEEASTLSLTPSFGTKSSSTSTTVTLTSGTNMADEFFSSHRGTDGFVSPEDWAIARDAWIQDGLDVSSFYTRFKKYINPADPQDY